MSGLSVHATPGAPSDAAADFAHGGGNERRVLDALADLTAEVGPLAAARHLFAPGRSSWTTSNVAVSP